MKVNLDFEGEYKAANVDLKGATKELKVMKRNFSKFAIVCTEHLIYNVFREYSMY